MELQINSGVKAKTVSTYSLHLGFMIGDADGDENINILVKKKDYDENPKVREALHAIINVAEACKDIYGRDSEDYYHVPGYVKYFTESGEDSASEEQREEEWNLMETFFETDHHESHFVCHPFDGVHDSMTSFDGWKLSYYNDNGDIQNVNVIFSEEDKAIHAAAKKKVKR